MAHRSLSTLVFSGFAPTTAATVISLMGDEGLPQELRIVQSLNFEPWHSARTGLMIVGMDPSTDLVRVSQLIQNRTTYWDVAVCIPKVLSYYSVALLAQGAINVLTHPEEDLEATKNQLRRMLKTLGEIPSDTFGLEVADLIQLYGEKRMAKTIRLTGPGAVGSVFLFNGNVVHAETMDDEEGMIAFRRLIAMPNPEIRVHKGCLTDHRTINIPAMSALLEGSRQMDEETRHSNDSERIFDSLDLEPSMIPEEFQKVRNNLNSEGEQEKEVTPTPMRVTRPAPAPAPSNPMKFRPPTPPPSSDDADPLRSIFGDDVDYH